MLNYIIIRLVKSGLYAQRDLAAIKREAALKFKQKMPTNIALIQAYHNLVKKKIIAKNESLEKILRVRQIRTLSGVAVITVLTKPWPCPGKCLYCPQEIGMPKSYLKNEPAAQRAYLTKFNPYVQVRTRLEALEMTGHKTDKIELIVLGGTWSAYPKNYQYWFISECFRACNDKNSKVKIQKSKLQFKSQNFRKRLKQEQKKNESAVHRIVGLTLETRPDYINLAEIKQMRELGCTRVEIGVQSIYDDVLKKNLRGNSVADVIHATKLLKDAGFKINYHIMLNLPGSSLKRDEKMFKELFSDERFRPDLLKIYPCVVLKTAPLYKLWKKSGYRPYSEKQLINLILRVKQKIPPYVRIQRIIRDIPGQSIVAGSKLTNLRQVIHNQLSSPPQLRGRLPVRRSLGVGGRGGGVQKFFCQCIRCREVRGQYSPKDKIKLFRREYSASGGKEVFLSYESPDQRKLYALLRLRIPSNCKIPPNLPLKREETPSFLKEGWGGFVSPIKIKERREELLPILKNSALIRELHTYGRLVPLTANRLRTTAVQHIGLGKKLMAEAEKIVRRETNLKRIAVISGIGVRGYYRKLGYRLKDEYMIKNLDCGALSPTQPSPFERGRA